MLITANSPVPSLEEFLANPQEHTEWVDGQLIEKKEMTTKTGRIQAKLSRFWGNYKESSGQAGEVYVETSCRTVGRVRCADVAYLTSELVAQIGDVKILPHSFSLVAEIISPRDEVEEVFTKVREYLESGFQEVWLVFPESLWVMVITTEHQKLYGMNDVAATQKVLVGFRVAVGELIA